MKLPDYISPTDVVKHFAEKGIKVSERELRRRAREIGAYRQIGKAIFFLPEDLERIMEPPEAGVKRSGRARPKSRRENVTLESVRQKLRDQGYGPKS